MTDLFVANDFVCRFNSIHDRHLDIHKNEIIVILFAQHDGLFSVGCYGDIDTKFIKSCGDEFLIDSIVFSNENTEIGECHLRFFRDDRFSISSISGQFIECAECFGII